MRKAYLIKPAEIAKFLKLSPRILATRGFKPCFTEKLLKAGIIGTIDGKLLVTTYDWRTFDDVQVRLFLRK